MIAGSANNQLREERHGDVITEKGILYAPDFIINAGGVMNIYDEMLDGGYCHDRALRKVDTIYDNIQRVIAISHRDKIPTYQAANILAEERINTIGQVRKTYM